jgi:hypothetical protein
MIGIGWPLLMFALGAFCAVIAFKPRATWFAMGGWPFRDFYDELRVITWRAVSAGFGALLLIGTGIWLLVTLDERECEQTLSGLEDEAADVSWVGPPEFGIDARLALEGAAHALDVELEEHGLSIDVVAGDGQVLGIIDEDGLHSRCG